MNTAAAAIATATSVADPDSPTRPTSTTASSALTQSTARPARVGIRSSTATGSQLPARASRTDDMCHTRSTTSSSGDEFAPSGIVSGAMTPLPLPNDQPGAQPQRAGRREWIGVAALALPCMLVVMDLSVLFLAVPSLSADLHPTPTQLLWITDVYGFLIAGALIAMGALGDRIGRRKVLVWGSAAFGAASVLAALSTSPEMLIAARGLQGIAGATLIPSTMSLLFAMFPHEEDRMKALGLISAGFTSGAALGPILGGVLLDVSTWHAVFLINVPAMLAVLWFVPRYVPEFANPAAPRVDLPSAGLLMLAVLPATYGIKRFARGTGGAVDAALIAFGVAVLRRPAGAPEEDRQPADQPVAVPDPALQRAAGRDVRHDVRDVRDVLLRRPVLPDRAEPGPAAGRALGPARDRGDDARDDGRRAEARDPVPPRPADGERRRADGRRPGRAVDGRRGHAARASSRSSSRSSSSASPRW